MEQEIGTRVVRLTDEYKFKSFDCGVEDLNEFLLCDAKQYAKRLVSVTYIIENDHDVVAYFSLSNDKIAIPDSDKATWRKIKQMFPHSKHRSDYPAVKIGRLGVNKKYQGMHIGTDILNFVKTMFLQDSRTGCAFITVDALKCALPFYFSNGFRYLDKHKAEINSPTYPLYYDLSQLLPVEM